MFRVYKHALLQVAAESGAAARRGHQSHLGHREGVCKGRLLRSLLGHQAVSPRGWERGGTGGLLFMGQGVSDLQEVRVPGDLDCALEKSYDDKQDMWC